jgi:hypothetical protein
MGNNPQPKDLSPHPRPPSDINATRTLFFADLTENGLVKIGADARVTTGSYEIGRAWTTSFCPQR